MGHRLTKNQRTLATQKSDNRVKEKSSNKRTSALRSSIIIKIRMLKMESKDLNNLTNNVKCDQNSKCSCNDNNGHQSTITTVPPPSSCQNQQYIQPDTQQSNMKQNEEFERLEDRINQINNDNSTTFVARHNQYNNRSTNSINNNIINDNEINNTDSIRPNNDMEAKMSSICDNVTSGISERIKMELKNIGVNNYKRSNLLMTRGGGCDNRPITNPAFSSPSTLIDRNIQSVDGVASENNSSIYPHANNTTTTLTTPSTSKGPDYVPMAPIKSSDKVSGELNDSEATSSYKKLCLPSDEGEFIELNFF